MIRYFILVAPLLFISALYSALALGDDTAPAAADDVQVIALVRFQGKPELENSPGKMEQRFAFFARMPHLKRKYYTEGEEASLGVYHWDSRNAAEAYYNKKWHAQMKQNNLTYSLELFDIKAIQHIPSGNITRLMRD